jgi:hypothetical protein
MRAMYLANYFVAGCIASSFLGWVASLHPMATRAIAFFGSSSLYFWGLCWLLDFSVSGWLKISVNNLQALLLAVWQQSRSVRGCSYAAKNVCTFRAAVALWLAPLTALDKRIGWHKSMQGLSSVLRLLALCLLAISPANWQSKTKLRKSKPAPSLLMWWMR